MLQILPGVLVHGSDAVQVSVLLLTHAAHCCCCSLFLLLPSQEECIAAQEEGHRAVQARQHLGGTGVLLQAQHSTARHDTAQRSLAVCTRMPVHFNRMGQHMPY